MKTTIKIIIATILIALGACSCNSTHELESKIPEIVDVVHSGCRGEWPASSATRSDEEADKTVLTFALSGNMLAFDINDIMLNCGFRDIDVKIECEGSDLTFTLVQTAYAADCYCRADVSAKIDNFKEGAYNVCIKKLTPYINPYEEEVDYDFSTTTVFNREVVIKEEKPTVIEITPPILY